MTRADSEVATWLDGVKPGYSRFSTALLAAGAVDMDDILAIDFDIFAEIETALLGAVAKIHRLAFYGCRVQLKRTGPAGKRCRPPTFHGPLAWEGGEPKLGGAGLKKHVHVLLKHYQRVPSELSNRPSLVPQAGFSTFPRPAKTARS